MLEDILLQVNKPGRYIGEEWNIARKDFSKSGIRFALCFPDLYEVGMSNLGLKILYGILNHIPDVACERVFSPDTDMEKIMRGQRIDIFSLESKRRLEEFDLIGFSLGHELNYTNVLNILDLGRIPLEASLRGKNHPLVIGGGPCTMNPEPIADFFDLFLIGEAEEAIVEIIDTYRRFRDQLKSSRISRQDLLINLSRIEGVYVPSLYKVKYTAGGKIEEFGPKIEGLPSRVRKRFIKDLNSSYYPLDWLVPYVQIIHDRITLEIMRGCPNRCRFCQARSQYFPFRKRELDSALRLASILYQHSGYEEISLAGLSVSDYPEIEKLSQSLISLFKDQGISVSLPSIKYKDSIGNVSSLIATVKKTGLTFAPEAGSERLRRIIGKDFDEEGFFKALEQVYARGWRRVKLYFMIGLPDETQEDLDGIADFSLRVSELKKKVSKSPAEVNISINTLIPKPHTALQWFAMESMDNIKHKQDYLRAKLKNRRFLKLNFHNRYMSFLEGVLSRGDRRLSRVILEAFIRGARFDAWGNYFRFDLWSEVFAWAGIDPLAYLKERSQDELLPWDFLDVGIGKDALSAEFNKPVAR